MMKAFLLFALLTLKAAAGNLFDIAVLYDLAIEEEFENGTKVYADCSGPEFTQRIAQLTDKAMENIQLVSKQGNEKHWLSFQDVGDEEHFFEIKEDGSVENIADEVQGHPGRRELSTHCNSFCKFMCQSTGRTTYCQCCSCCGNSRRRLGSSQVKILDTSAENLEKLETLAEDAVYAELEKKNIDCLAGPIDVKLVPQEKAMTWEERRAQRKAWRQAHRADRRAKRQARKKLRAAINKQVRIQNRLDRALKQLELATQQVQQAEEGLDAIGVLDEKEEQKAEEEEEQAKQEEAQPEPQEPIPLDEPVEACQCECDGDEPGVKVLYQDKWVIKDHGIFGCVDQENAEMAVRTRIAACDNSCLEDGSA